MNANLYALLYDHFREDAEQPCLLIPGGPVIHYDDLDAMSGRMARMNFTKWRKVISPPPSSAAGRAS